ncbi:MAG: FHA domain-containing protein [Planctomycetota bacterium]
MAIKIKCDACGYKNNTMDDLVCRMCSKKIDPNNRWNDAVGHDPAVRGQRGGGAQDATLGIKASVQRGAAKAIQTKADGPTQDQIVYVGDFAICYVLAPFGGGRVILKPGEVFTLGRGEACDYKIDSKAASRRHARIHWSNDPPTPEIVDLDSKNGILINGEPVDRKVLEDEDVITIGPFTGTFRVLPANDIDGQLGQIDRLSATTSTHMRLVGEVKLVPIPWLLQHLERQKESGTLTVYGEDAGGYVAMISGVAIAAAYGRELETTGVEAIKAIAALRTGRFSFSPKADATPQSIGATMAEIFGPSPSQRLRRRPPPPPRRGGGGPPPTNPPQGRRPR